MDLQRTEVGCKKVLIMKMTKIFFVLISLFAVACNTTPNGNGGSTGGGNTKWDSDGVIIGEWELASFNNSDEAKPRVYIEFREQGNEFTLYQQAYSVVWFRYEGTFTFDGTTLSGVYSDGKAWAAEYTVSFAKEPNRMRLIRKEDNKDISIYIESEIPETIIDEAREPENVRSVMIERFL